jgi:hypothetical protein
MLGDDAVRIKQKKRNAPCRLELAKRADEKMGGRCCEIVVDHSLFRYPMSAIKVSIDARYI